MSETPEDDFSSFFSAALTGEPEVSPETPEVPAPDPEPVIEDPLTPEPEPVVEEPVPVVEPVAATPDPSEALREELALLRAEVERLRTTPPAPVEEPVQQVDPDAAIIAEFADQWPDNHKAVQAMIRQAVSEAVGGLVQQLKPTVQTVQETQLAKLHNEIRQLEPEFDSLAKPVAEWVESIPDSMAGLRQGFRDALWPRGRPANAQEIANVFKMYRAWNPGATPAPVVSAPAPTPSAPIEKPRQTRSNVRDILKTMAPVSSRPVAPAAGPDEDDFGSNFAEALRSV